MVMMMFNIVRTKSPEKLKNREYTRISTHLDGFVGNIDHAGAKFDANCKIMDGLEALIGELKKEAGFSDSCVVRIERGRRGSSR